MKDLPKSCCIACSYEVIDFDKVKDSLFTNPRPKSCDGILSEGCKVIFLEMKTLLGYWENKHHDYIRHLKESGISKRDLYSIVLPPDSDPWYRGRLREKIAIDFAHPETYLDSCKVLSSLASSIGRLEAWTEAKRQDEYIFVHDADRSVELTDVVTEDVAQLFLTLFDGISERLDSQVQSFTPLMLSCTEFETKYTPAKA